MANQTSYKYSISSAEDEKHVESTIEQIGNNLVKLDLKASKKCWKYWLDGVNFFDRVLRKCPNLQTLRITSGISPNLMFGIVGQTQQQLEDLSIRYLSSNSEFLFNRERINEWSPVSLARELKKLKSFKVEGVDWCCSIICNFLRKAKKLEDFICEINETAFELDKVFLNQFRSKNEMQSRISQKGTLSHLIQEKIYMDLYAGEADFWGQN